MIDISIIVPVYNVEGLLIQCIESILNQTFQNFELVLINDGSKDKSGEICEKYAVYDRRIVYINQNNQGVSSARNNGIEVSSGKWICFIDSDDLVGVNYLSNLYNAVTTNDNVFFVSSGTDSVDSNGNFLRELMHYPDTVLEGVECLEIITKYKLMNIGPSGKLFSSDIIKTNNLRFNKNLSYSEDVLFMLQYLYYVDKIVLLSAVDYSYRVWNVNSLSNTISTFNKEYVCYVELKKAGDVLLHKFDNPIQFETILKEKEIYYIRRVIYSCYKTKDLSRKDRIQFIRNICNENYDNLKLYWERCFFFDRIGYRFLMNRSYILYDSYMKLIFLLRGAVGNNWYKFRKFFLR